MKPLSYIYLLGIALVLFSSCSNGDEEPDAEIGGGGTLTLSGDEAHYTSGKLEVSETAYGRADLTGLEESLVAVSSGISIPKTAGEELVPEGSDLEQQFVVVASEMAISMSIFADGTKRDYVSDVSKAINVTIDQSSKEVTFNDAAVVNADNGSILTLNGTLVW
ncbi:hypothetical protein DN752_14430 [Echinicola strongylocentroti]|uniref:Lipocalin-like domain-containing protein n=1 Tax=Echinicola strongylocentroti TaxID=1795355 RepID=A0A2Z4IJA1_9BACT|nr:hypothetical protein [Echinicola strongylocentroti]AWW31222.1 hypothetical protein DN752_14430 [Echinicola strongylocentroti]